MTSEQFVYWFQGFVELDGAEPTPEQWQSIKDHLQTVFKKVTPPVIGPGLFSPHRDLAKMLRDAAPGLGSLPVATC